MTFKILPCLGHVELHINGTFYCTADNHREAMKEYNKYVKERLKDEDKSRKGKVQHS
jgi:hypothetical protein